MSATPRPDYRFMHVMMRVLDLERSLDFYVRILGMRMLRERAAPEGRYTNVFVGYEDERNGTVVELTYNWDRTDPYAPGEAYGHLALGVPDVYAACSALSKAGVKIVREPGPVKHGTTVIAFIEDPDGHKIELVQEPAMEERRP